MEAEGVWNLIESDPGVFSELIRKFGAKGVQVEELWSLDEEAFEDLKPVHGLIFLFKWVQDDEPIGELVKDSRLNSIFFAKQVITNACATQAVISLLMNCKHPDLELGLELAEFHEFCSSFDPKMRGLAITNSPTIRTVHNSFARQNFFEYDDKSAAKSDDVFHYVGYMAINGRVYELDGLKEGPMDLGPVGPDNDWIKTIRPVIQRRMNKYNQGEIHFNLMALVSDRKMIYERQLAELCKKTRGGIPADQKQAEIERVHMLIAFEDAKFRRYRAEIARRRHNYIPFIIELLKVLGKRGMLMSVYEDAKNKAAEKQSRRIAWK